jgi:glycosyltransferase involved in cell wall biosynthesis
MNSIFIVVPVFNEHTTLPVVLESLMTLPCTIVVVDDGSVDGSETIARKLSHWILRHPVNLGQGAALQTGITFALENGASHIVTFDSDGQHRPDDVMAMVKALSNCKADFALGSRFLGEAPGIPWTRQLVLRLGVWFTRLLSGIAVTDTHNGLRAMTRRGATSLRITMNRMEHASELLDQIVASGLPYVEVPVRIEYTKESLSKGQSSSRAFRMAAKVIVERLR